MAGVKMQTDSSSVRFDGGVCRSSSAAKGSPDVLLHSMLWTATSVIIDLKWNTFLLRNMFYY